jgi:hypothetical protein
MSFDASVLSRLQAKITFFVAKNAVSFTPTTAMWSAPAVRNAAHSITSLDFDHGGSNRRFLIEKNGADAPSPNEKNYNYGNVDWPQSKSSRHLRL